MMSVSLFMMLFKVEEKTFQANYMYKQILVKKNIQYLIEACNKTVIHSFEKKKKTVI